MFWRLYEEAYERTEATIYWIAEASILVGSFEPKLRVAKVRRMPAVDATQYPRTR